MSHRPVRRGAAILGAGALLLLLPTGVASATSTGHATAAAPLIRVRSSGQRTGTESSNWSGYGIGGDFSAVAGSWVVPAVTRSTTPTYSSTWIGIDGMANQKLIQTGTESDYFAGGAHYDAWWEVLPDTERVITTLTVAPGNHMSASIVHVGTKGKRWTITLTDTTTRKSFSFTRSYRGPGASAEWIEERPQVGRSSSELADYNSTTFTGLTANGVRPGLTTGKSISMVAENGTSLISTPSVPSPLGDGFTVAYGATPPAAPAG